MSTSAAGSGSPLPRISRESSSGETITPTMLARAALNIVPMTFPPAIWVKTIQLDMVVGRIATAKTPVYN